MSLFQVNKPKSAAKIILPPGEHLDAVVRTTLSEIAQIVGATLGPGGRQVLIERPEIGMRPIITKDGVTVIKHLGFESASQQLVLEAARDAAIRTASEAGDGTSTSSILSYAIAEETHKAVSKNNRISPQMILRELTATLPLIEEIVKSHAIVAETEETLLKVAELSANGDTVLAKAVLEALAVVGDDGNMTIIEAVGRHGYKIDRMHGYTVEQGYENSCRNMGHGFINDKTGTKINLAQPIVLLFDGVINDSHQVLVGFNAIHQYLQAKGIDRQDVLLVAHGFSDAVLGDLHLNWNHAQTKVKVVPLLTPESFIRNSRSDQLLDIQAYAGSNIFNPIDKSIADINVEDLIKYGRVKSVEIDRFKAIILAEEDELAINDRVEELKERAKSPESEYETHELNLRIGKLTSGIARLEISAPSIGETREKRDRAEDAWMAVKGAITHGAVPGGGFVLAKLSERLSPSAIEMSHEPISPRTLAHQILANAFAAPVVCLHENYGSDMADAKKRFNELKKSNKPFDVLKQEYVETTELLDSVPAVIEAIRSSLSIASLLGSLGGIVCFQRNSDSDKAEEKFARNYENSTGLRGEE